LPSDGESGAEGGRATKQPLVVGVTCRNEDCNWGPLGDDDPARSWDIIERLRIQHEDETGHQTRVECVRESRIVPSMGDRIELGDAVIEMADDRVDWICPECHCSGEDLETTKRCPNCDERLREVLPDGGADRTDATNRDCIHVRVEVYDVTEEDPGPNSGWHEVKAECQDCGRRMSCLIEWGALQSDVKEVSGPNAE